MPLSADLIRSLHKYEFRVLQSIEYLMKRYDWVPLEELIHNTRLSETETRYRAGRLMERGMIKSAQVPYQGYALIFTGYDTLAIEHLTKKGVISSLGSMVGEGKEAIVYEALGIGPLILKLHRLGQRSFQTVRRSRTFMPDNGHCPWILASHLSAEQEYLALSALHQTVSVPVPVSMNRNVIAMSLIQGANLNGVTLDTPEPVYESIITEIAKAYRKGFIHGDLSEYNIMTDGEKVWIIDWPQWVAPDHINAGEILDHDLETIKRFFFRKYRIERSLEELRARVIG